MSPEERRMYEERIRDIRRGLEQGRDPTQRWDWAMWEAVSALGLNPQSALTNPVILHSLDQLAANLRMQYASGLRDNPSVEEDQGPTRDSSWRTEEEARLRQLSLGDGYVVRANDLRGWDVIPAEMADDYPIRDSVWRHEADAMARQAEIGDGFEVRLNDRNHYEVVRIPEEDSTDPMDERPQDAPTVAEVDQAQHGPQGEPFNPDDYEEGIRQAGEIAQGIVDSYGQAAMDRLRNTTFAEYLANQGGGGGYPAWEPGQDWQEWRDGFRGHAEGLVGDIRRRAEAAGGYGQGVSNMSQFGDAPQGPHRVAPGGHAAQPIHPGFSPGSGFGGGFGSHGGMRPGWGQPPQRGFGAPGGFGGSMLPRPGFGGQVGFPPIQRPNQRPSRPFINAMLGG